MGISDKHATAEKGFTGSTTETTAANGEYKLDVASTCNFSYHYTFLDQEGKGSAFSFENTYLADYFRGYGRCVTVIDARVYEIYGEAMRAYFSHHGLKLEVLAMGIDEEQKSLKTCEDCMIFFADVGLMRRETPLVVGGGLITDIIGTACALYRRSTSYVRLPTTLIGLIDASVAIKVGGNLAGKHKNRIGAFHPHAGVILDFHFLATLPEQHIRNGLAELIKISTVEEARCFELIENHCEDLLKFKFGYLEVAEDGSKCPAGLREVGRELARRAVRRMLQLECPNLHEHDQKRAIAYGHTWSPCYELAQSPPMHHGHAIAVDMSFSLTWAERLGYIDAALKERVLNVFRRVGLSLMHPWFDEKSLKKGTDTIMARRDGDLYAAIPAGRIGVCRYVMVGDFQTGNFGDAHEGNNAGRRLSFEEGRAALDASLEAALVAHREYTAKTDGDRFGNGAGVGKTPYISLGHARSNCGDFCACSKLELGTWGERLVELCEEVEESQSFEAVREKVQGIARWWEMCGQYVQDHSSPLGETALRILEEQQKTGVFPEGMSVDWALDVQSAQTLDFLAALKANSYAKKMIAVPPPPLATMQDVDTSMVMTRQTSEAIKKAGKGGVKSSEAGDATSTVVTTAKNAGGNSSQSEKSFDKSDEEASSADRDVSPNVQREVSEVKLGDFPSASESEMEKDAPPAYDAAFSNGMVAWDLGTLTGVSAAVLGSHFDAVETVEREPALANFAAKHLQSNVRVNVGEIDAWLLAQKKAGKKADMIFMDLDKTAYEPLYRLIMENGLLRDGGLLVADNVLYRGLPAELECTPVTVQKYEDMGTISKKTRLNAEALVRFNSLVKSDVEAGSVRSLMLPVRDGMMAVVKLASA